MTLQGILGQSLGSFICLRGFAKLGDLYDASDYDTGYQRTLISEHGADIARFYNDREYLFFPEIILGVSVQKNSSDEAEMRSFYEYIISNNSDNQRFTFSWCKISVKNMRSTSTIDKRITTTTRFVSIVINDPINSESKFLSRIDGNHRLSAVEYKNEDEAIDGSSFKDLNAPFCLILFRDRTDNAQHSRVIFHNINYKSIPLDKEENLKLILDDEQNLYSNEVLMTNPSFGIPFLLARKLSLNLNQHSWSGLKRAFEKRYNKEDFRPIVRTTLLNLCQLLHEKGIISDTDEFLNNLIDSIQTVNELYKNYHVLKTSHSQAILLILIYYQLTDISRCQTFRDWVITNHIYLSEEVEATQLLTVFETILSAKKHEIFVSMQFSIDTEPHFKAILEAVSAVNQRYNVSIKVTRVDQLNKGYSYQIPSEILGLVNTSGLLIADLTHGNKNVYHEVGYLMGLNRGKGLNQRNFIFVLRNNQPTEGDTDKEVGFNLRDWQQIRFNGNDVIDLKNKLVESIVAYYNL